MRFVNQHVTATAGIDCRLCGICIARDYDAAIRRIEAVPVTFHGMLCDKRSDRHVRVLVDDAGGDLVRIHFVTLREPSLIAIHVGACLDVDAVGFEEMLGHSLETLGTVDL